MNPTILITGRDGQLGYELRRTMAPLGRVVAVDIDTVNFSDIDAVRRLVRDTRPDVIMNAAAYTAVDAAEDERELAYRINAEVPGVLAEELSRIQGKLIVHYSTDYVFDGKATRPYREDDPTDPVNYYGKTKRAGEEVLQKGSVPYAIFRTEWLYASRGKNFLLTILRLAKQGKPLRIVADQVGAPTWARMLAEASALAVARFLNAGEKERTTLSGIYHATAAGETTWHGFAAAILTEKLEMLKRAKGDTQWCESALQSLTPIASSEYVTSARRPMYSLLSNEKLAQVYGIRLPHWSEQLKATLEELSAD